MRKVDPTIEQKVFEQLKAGKKCREIADSLNVSNSFVTTVRQRNNLPCGNKGRPKTHKKPPPPCKTVSNIGSGEYGYAF